MRPAWSPSSLYSKVAEANRLLYAKTALRYETTEEGTVSSSDHKMLDADLEAILRDIGYPGRRIRALDACGGTGKIALKLAQKGINVTICDISSELLDIFRDKCDRMGLEAEVVCQEIGVFLSSNERKFDLIVFSAALHHLEDIPGVLKLASENLSERGMVYCVLESTMRSPAANALQQLDYIAFKALHQPDDFLAALARRLKRLINAKGTRAVVSKQAMDLLPENIGILAEYHADRGIDDMRLAAELTSSGTAVVWHVRYPTARYFPFRVLLRMLRCPTAFKMLLKNTGVDE